VNRRAGGAVVDSYRGAVVAVATAVDNYRDTRRRGGRNRTRRFVRGRRSHAGLEKL